MNSKKNILELKDPARISKKFAIVIGIFSSLILIVSIIVFYKDYSSSKRLIIKDLEYQSSRIESNFIGSVRYAESSMEYISKQIVDHGKLDLSFIKDLLASYRLPKHKILELSIFSWTNRDHRLVVSSVKGFHFDENLDLSKRDYIPKTVSIPSKIHLGEPIFGIYSKKWSIPAGYGVVDKKNKYVGSIVVGIVIEGMKNKIIEILGSQNIDFAILQSNGDFIVNSGHLEASYLQSLILDNQNLINKSDNGVLFQHSIGSKKNHGSIYFNNVENFPYIILTIYDKNFESNSLYNLLWSHVIILIITFIVISILVLFLYYSLITPILTLSNAIKELSRGNDNIKIPRSGSIEINNLSKAILMVKHSLIREFQKLKLAKEENINKDIFLSAISHDLRNPISAIKSMIEAIESDKKDKKLKLHDIEDSFVKIKEQAQESLDFLEELLDIKQSNSGLLKLGAVKLENLNKILTNSIKLSQPNANPKNITIINNSKNSDFLLHCNARRIRQIFYNLIGNAIKYSPNNKTIEICLSDIEEKNSIMLEIQDYGYGMSEEEVKMALDGRGSEVKINNVEKTDSHGIGLPNVKHLVKLHNAQLEIKSQKGEGTKITIIFPKDNGLENVNKSLKILLADDDEVSSKMIEKNILNHSKKANILIAKNGLEALEIFKNNNDFDFILMDIEMPIMNGIEAIKEIRKINMTVPIISHSSEIAKKNLVLEAGANDFVSKSDDKNLLMRNIFKWSLLEIIPKTSKLEHDNKNKKILIADDNETNSLILISILKRNNFTVDYVSNGLGILEKLLTKDHGYDLLITDINMEKISGDEVVKQIREFEKEHNITNSIPIIAYSGDKEKEKIYHFLNCGMNDYFVKGASLSNLILLVNFWIHR